MIGEYCDKHIGNLLNPDNGQDSYIRCLGVESSLPNPFVDNFCINGAFYHLTLCAFSENEQPHVSTPEKKLALIRARQQVLDYPRLFLRVLHTSESDKLRTLVADLFTYSRLWKECKWCPLDRDGAIHTVFAAIRLCLDILRSRPRELTSQLIGRIDLYRLEDAVNSDFLEDLRRFVLSAKEFGVGPNIQWLCPSLKTALQCAGGNLLNSIVVSHNDVNVKEPACHPLKDQVAFCKYTDQEVGGTTSVPVYNSITGELIKTINTHASHSTYAVSYSSDGKFLAIAGGSMGQVR